MEQPSEDIDESVLARRKSAVTRFFDLMNAADLDGAFGMLTADADWFSLSTRRFSHREQMRASIEWVNRSLLRAPIVQTILSLTAEENRVAALTTGSADTVEGARYDQAYHFLFEFDGDRISRIWEFNDTAHSRTVFHLEPDGSLPESGPVG